MQCLPLVSSTELPLRSSRAAALFTFLFGLGLLCVWGCVGVWARTLIASACLLLRRARLPYVGDVNTATATAREPRQ